MDFDSILTSKKIPQLIQHVVKIKLWAIIGQPCGLKVPPRCPRDPQSPQNGAQEASKSTPGDPKCPKIEPWHLRELPKLRARDPVHAQWSQQTPRKTARRTVRQTRLHDRPTSRQTIPFLSDLFKVSDFDDPLCPCSRLHAAPCFEF